MRTCLLSILVSFSLLSLQVGQAVAQPAFTTDSLLTSRIFPILSWMETDNKMAKIILKDKELQGLKKNYLERLSLSLCSTRNCFGERFKLTGPEIDLAAGRLIRLYNTNRKLRKKLAVFRHRGLYPGYSEKSDTGFLRHAWLDAANGINRIFDVYVNGIKPRYAAIDSISFAPGDTVYTNQLQLLSKRFPAKAGKDLFFEDVLHAALDVLRKNKRHEAIAFEPLNAGMNKDAFQKINATDFTRYAYSLILVPGLGPEIPGQALAPGGAKRCREGAARYKKGLAPFIVVSGGNVHPFQTPFNEAVEMKKYMVDTLGVPSDAILIEPYARHTTTNLRNTNRMIYHFGIPQDKPVLIVTDSSQAAYIAGRMSSTAKRDLGYVPFEKLKQITEKEIEYFPVRISLQADPFDPLDP